MSNEEGAFEFTDLSFILRYWVTGYYSVKYWNDLWKEYCIALAKFWNSWMPDKELKGEL
jgi:hypothetical protein